MARVSVSLFALAALLACSGVFADDSSRLRGIIGTSGPGGETKPMPLSAAGLLACPKGKTMTLTSRDAAQSPSCEPCGSMLQFACGGSSCKKGLKPITNPGVPQPICIKDDKFKVRKASRTARGRNRAKGGDASVSITREVGCGIAGMGCCADGACNLGCDCIESTCIPSVVY